MEIKMTDNLYELREDIFEDFMKDGYRYIARDKDGAIFAYSDEPIKREKVWLLTSTNGTWQDISLMSRLFADVKWKDEEPFRIPYINLDNAPVDTKVIVTGVDGSEWHCHFYKKLNDNSILVFRDGKTSWTTSDVVEVDVDNVTLARLIEVKK